MSKHMSKSKEYITTLISAGKIVKNLHFEIKTHTVLNKCDFIITVVKDTQHPNSLGFSCFSKENRPQVMGFDNSDIIQQLLGDIIFRLYMINLGKLNVIVLGMGESKKPEWNYAEEGYKSIFQSHYDEEVLENLYKYHLKRKMSQEVKWHDLFDKWLNQKSDILELRKAILDLYPSDYKINDQE
ncbi:hypothetical protein GLOIN_2v1880126 [Rhizophagus clarus]|uniref:Uncharacterized protein n=1 Tax=Rhizophagus clarus TaxID=94130 RepID=A0A8H3LXT0_9GLOM|nr:hypothetical protein GLOIN_2v1880126 [Rhizophagus clarus]